MGFYLCVLRMAVDTVVSLTTGRRRVAVFVGDEYSLWWAVKDIEQIHGDKPERWPYIPAWPYDEANVHDLRAAGFWVVYTGTGRKLPPTWGR